MALSRVLYLAALPGQLLRMAIYLAIVVAVHNFYIVIPPMMLWSLIGIIVVSAFVPRRFSSFASGIGFLTMAVVAYFQFGVMGHITLLCGIFGVWSMFDAISDFRSTRRFTT